MDTNKYEIIVTEIAKEELNEIYKYISEHLLEPVIADKLINKIEQKILNLEKNPYSCAEIYVKPRNKAYRKLVIDNYIVLYKVDAEKKQVIIYRIIYGKMDYLI